MTHDGNARYCAAETVTITMRNGDGSIIPDYVGTVTLTTGTGEGEWSLLTGGGAFAQAGANDGVATYTFAAADGGSANFALAYSGAAAALDVDAVADGAWDNDAEGLLAFHPNGLTLTATPLPVRPR